MDLNGLILNWYLNWYWTGAAALTGYNLPIRANCSQVRIAHSRHTSQKQRQRRKGGYSVSFYAPIYTAATTQGLWSSIWAVWWLQLWAVPSSWTWQRACRWKVLFYNGWNLVPCIATPAFASGYMAVRRQPGLCDYVYIYAQGWCEIGNIYVYLYSYFMLTILWSQYDRRRKYWWKMAENRSKTGWKRPNMRKMEQKVVGILEKLVLPYWNSQN